MGKRTADLLPPNLQGDINLEALCGAIDSALSIEDELDALDISDIDAVPSSVLPLLAWQYHILGDEGWLIAQDDGERRALIKQARDLHRHRGTKYAIEKVLELLHLDGKVTEWFQYGGDPFHFKVQLDVSTRGIDMELEARLEAMVNTYKNKRSRLDEIKIFLAINSAVPVYAMASMGGEKTTVYPYAQTLLSEAMQMSLAAGYLAGETTTIYPLTN